MFNKRFYQTVKTLLLISSTSMLPAQKSINSSLKTTGMTPVSAESFKHSDIGNPAITGTVKVLKDGFDITAGGADIWGTKDEFNFIYIEQNGDFDFVSRIESLSGPHLYTKAGLMAREDLTPDSRHIYFQIFPNNNPRNKNNGGFEFQYRTEKGVEMKAIYPKSFEGIPEFPVAFPNTWIRLQRTENVFTAYYSIDGKTWKIYTTFSMVIPAKLFLGLAVTSHEVKDTATAKFRDIAEIKH
jgi:hypothetical protein